MTPIARPLAPRRRALGVVLHVAYAGALAGSIGLVGGCPSPKPDEKYDDFLDQTEDEREDAANVKMDVGGTLADVNGQFLFALASFLSPPTPLQFLADITFVENTDGSGGTISMTLQPLSLDVGSTTTPRQPVGDPLAIEETPVMADGSFFIDIQTPFMAPGEANPITGSPIAVMSLQLTGSIQSEDLICGIADGQVTSPIETALTGSTFGVERVTGLDALPMMVIGACPEGAGESGGESGSESGGSSSSG
jgi:hypothetical protein